MQGDRALKSLASVQDLVKSQSINIINSNKRLSLNANEGTKSGKLTTINSQSSCKDPNQKENSSTQANQGGQTQA